jgi:hypothetical protein
MSETSHPDQSGIPEERPTLSTCAASAESVISPAAVQASATPENNPSHSEKDSVDRQLPAREKLLKKLTGTRSRIAYSLIGTVLTGAVATVLGGIALGWFSPGASDNTSATQEIVYQPWSNTQPNKIANGFHVVSQSRGKCLDRSGVTSRPDAYRCFEGDYVLDPCFPNPYYGSKIAACPFNGPSGVVLIHLTKRLSSPAFYGKTPPSPWLITLNDGRMCYAFSGAGAVSGGLLASYNCPHSTLFGSVRRTGKIWTIFEAQNDSPDMTLARIVTAYF